MKASLLYRIASVVLVLFAVGHTLGFARPNPAWGVEGLVGSMRTTRFVVQGFSRSYWGFYLGFGLFVTVFLLFSAALAWQVGSMPAEVLKALPVLTWGLTLCFAAVTVLTWMYFFIAPGIFSTVVVLVLALAAVAAGRG